MIEIKDLNKQNSVLFSPTGGLNIVRISYLFFILIYRFSVVLIKTKILYFIDTNNLILNSMQEGKRHSFVFLKHRLMQWIVAKYDNRIKSNFTGEKSEELGQLREVSRIGELFLTYLVKMSFCLMIFLPLLHTSSLTMKKESNESQFFSSASKIYPNLKRQ